MQGTEILKTYLKQTIPVTCEDCMQCIYDFSWECHVNSSRQLIIIDFPMFLRFFWFYGFLTL